MYSLFATVNHFGNLQSGHYVANVKVNEKWFHCNDAHVAQAGIGIGEREVLQSNAYLLFYIRSK
jgi:ubiquitin C-terminal hydrolase